MEAKTNYTMVGLIVVILTAGLITAGLWLSVGFNQKQYTIYAVYFHEAVSGLSEDSPVKYNGVQVGRVYKINLSRTDPQEVQILLNIEEGTPITTSTSAALISQGITGTTFVGLKANSSDLTPLRKIPEEPYPIIPTTPSLLNQLDSVLKEVSENVNSVSLKLKEVFDKENIQNLKQILDNLESFSSTIAQNNSAITQGMQNSNILLHNMADASKSFPEVISDLKRSINQLTGQISQAGESVSQAMKAGKVTIDKINETALPSAISLLQHLNNTAVNLEKTSNQLRQNPSIIIRGTSPPRPGPGEHNE